MCVAHSYSLQRYCISKGRSGVLESGDGADIYIHLEFEFRTIKASIYGYIGTCIMRLSGANFFVAFRIPGTPLRTDLGYSKRKIRTWHTPVLLFYCFIVYCVHVLSIIYTHNNNKLAS